MPTGPAPRTAASPGPIVLFDGVCNLCNGTVRFLVDRDPRGAIRYASLQGATGQSLLRAHGLPTDAFDTFVLVEGERHYTRSTAALRTLAHLGGLWRAARLLLWIPAFLRDAIYGWVARNRYRWFGREETCRLPSPELASRFLDP